MVGQVAEIDPQGLFFDLQAAVYGVVIEKFEGEWLIFPASPDCLEVQSSLFLEEANPLRASVDGT